MHLYFLWPKQWIAPINPNLTTEQHNSAVEILKDFAHIFTNKTEDLTACKIPSVRIRLKTEAKPVYRCPYRHSITERKTLAYMRKLKKLVAAGILEFMENYSEYQSPMFIVHSKNDTNQIITDFRGVNFQTQQDIFLCLLLISYWAPWTS